jgi:hypothetical protein
MKTRRAAERNLKIETISPFALHLLHKQQIAVNLVVPTHVATNCADSNCRGTPFKEVKQAMSYLFDTARIGRQASGKVCYNHAREGNGSRF